ncbi:sugar phosphate nucleotidyltransferase [Bacillus weihaiensis]|uniref:Glucose-1-phosphate adenylyltransferase n=1 Tax=Bacillus weihaiensis TaxID=1547283 RepID=A0A1L3MX85_9BACI|nr:sugar phosphate nucleotidyltransferase [Bacillus weihaiensis]APH06947.1 glucose-1-phosphate adenylyltransferase [Bacillus weihaiensis]
MLAIIDSTAFMPEMEDLTLHRSLGAIPFAGRYRLIDFVLSNMVNSDIESVAIFPKYSYRSLMDHVGSGKQWDLNRKKDGLFFFPSPHLHNEYDEFGSFRQFQDHYDYFLRSSQEYAVITNSHTVCNIDYKKVLERHIENRCDITEVRKNGESLQMYMMSTTLLKDLIEDKTQTGCKTLSDIIVDNRKNLTICDFEFSGYAARIDSISSYYKHSLELLNPDIWQEIFKKDRPILTKAKDEPPTMYGKDSVVKNSLIANGCKIEGHVENSIIFRGVHIGKDTVIKNSVIMQKTNIGEQCLLENVIADKDVKVLDYTQLEGGSKKPLILRKKTIQGAMMNS